VKNSRAHALSKASKGIHFPSSTLNFNTILETRMMGMSGSHKDNGPFLDFLKIITNEHQNIKAFKQEFNDCYQRKDIGMMKKIANSTILTAALHSDSEEARCVYTALLPWRSVR
jgi:hypothetical protein